MRQQRVEVLRISLPPRGLNREQGAARGLVVRHHQHTALHLPLGPRHLAASGLGCIASKHRTPRLAAGIDHPDGEVHQMQADLSATTLTTIMAVWLLIVLAFFAYPLSAFSKPLTQGRTGRR